MPKRLTTQQIIARDMREAELQLNVIELAEALGYTVFHIRDSRGQRLEGLPDLLLMKPNRLLWMELKREAMASRHTALTDAQEWVRGLLMASSQEYYLVRPSDWLNGTVQALLTKSRYPGRKREP